MKSKGNGIRYETASALIDRAKANAPGPGVHQAGLKTIWCFRCDGDKPMMGSARVGELYKCADCLEDQRKARLAKGGA